MVVFVIHVPEVFSAQAILEINSLFPSSLLELLQVKTLLPPYTMFNTNEHKLTIAFVFYVCQFSKKTVFERPQSQVE